MEQFKTILGYEGLYEVSNFGNVKSLWYGKDKILKPQADGGGYLFVWLCKDGKQKIHKVHRLVASAFIPNPDNLSQVNHKDEDKTNNRVDNLEWCTQEYNLNYGTRNTRVAEAQRGVPRPYVVEALTNRTDQSIPIDMLTKDGEPICTFPSSAEAMRWLWNNGYPKAQNSRIIQCCKGREHYNTAYGFKWRYSNES